MTGAALTEAVTVDVLSHTLDALDPISLDEMNRAAQLLSRVDRKYFVPRAVVAELLAEADEPARVLEIDGERSFWYRTVYFDSPDFRFYRDHVQRRRQRFKVRTRTYCSSGDCMLEVKSKGYRGRTMKQRITHDPGAPDRLSSVAARYVNSVTGGEAEHLAAVLETLYRRTTVVLGDQRITLDVDLASFAGGARCDGPDDVLVETKSPDRASPFDAALLHRGIRPHSVSKYCVSAAMLYPHLPHNPWARTLRRRFTVSRPDTMAG